VTRVRSIHVAVASSGLDPLVLPLSRDSTSLVVVPSVSSMGVWDPETVNKRYIK